MSTMNRNSTFLEGADTEHVLELGEVGRRHLQPRLLHVGGATGSGF